MQNKIVSFSGGKDSTAMLLRLLEIGAQVDRIMFADTGFEFPEMYDYINKIQQIIPIKIEWLKPEKTFDSWRLGRITRGKKSGQIRGMPLKAYPCYWTRESKVKPMEKAKSKGDIFYIGIAADEPKRIRKQENIEYPLVKWGWTEHDCLDYLKKQDLLNPLYKKFDRLGCWMCPKQPLKSWAIVYRDYPKLWERVKCYNKENIKMGNPSMFYSTIEIVENKLQGLNNGE